MSDTSISSNPIELATDLTVAWLSNPNTRTSANDVPSFLKCVYETIAMISGDNQATLATEAGFKEYTPAVTARKSLASADAIISMVDGKPYKTLRRHLSANGMTPTEYRERYRLKADYPMVAPAYSESRRAIAKQIGLGRNRAQKSVADVKAKLAAPRERTAKQTAADN